MRHELAEVVQREQHKGDALEVEEVGGSHQQAAHHAVHDLGLLIFALDLLEVQFGKHVHVVGQLNDEVELVQERHRMVGEIVPEQGQGTVIALADDNVGAPQERHQVEDDQLAGLVEATQFELGQVQPLRDFL